MTELLYDLMQTTIKIGISIILIAMIGIPLFLFGRKMTSPASTNSL